jgi:hypothetical protein
MARKVVGYDENGPIYSDQTPSGSANVQKDPKSEKAEEPGWFMPGSKSEAAVRGFSQGATLGLAPRISAMLSPGSYGENLKQYLAADKAASEAHPVVSGVANLVGGAPSMIASGAGSIPAQIAKQAGIGALSGAGNAQEGNVARDAATGAAISGAMAGALPAVAGGAKSVYNMFKGKADPKAITEAAIKFKNAPRAPSAGVTGPRSAQEIQNDLKKTYDTLPIVNKRGVEIDVKHAAEGGKPLTGGIAEARGDDLMRELTHGYQGPKLPLDPNIKNLSTSSEDLRQIINAHNVQNATGAGRTILGSMAGGAALGAGGAALSSGADLNTTLAGAAGGAASGALGGARYNAVRNTSKLRMPMDTPNIPGAGFANAEISNAVGNEVKEKLDVPRNPFGKLTDYLGQSSGSNNPDVQEMAQAAQEVADSNDASAKRKAAMVLQTSPEGRAVGNGDSPTRYYEN